MLTRQDEPYRGVLRSDKVENLRYCRADAFRKSIRNRCTEVGDQIRATEAERDTHTAAADARPTGQLRLPGQLPELEPHLSRG